MAADDLRKDKVVLGLARGLSTDAAAKEGKVSGRTVRRWLATDPDFKTRVNDVRAELLGRTVGALVDAAVEAVETLRASLADGSPHVRVRAATAILNAVVVVRETVDHEQRLAEIEAQLRAADGDEGAGY